MGGRPHRNLLMAGHRFHNRVGCVVSGGTIFIAYEIHLAGAARFSTREKSVIDIGGPKKMLRAKALQLKFRLSLVRNQSPWTLRLRYLPFGHLAWQWYSRMKNNKTSA